MKKISRWILASAIFLTACNLLGQSRTNYSATQANATSTSFPTQNLTISELNELKQQTTLNSWRGKHQIQLSIGKMSDFGVDSKTSIGHTAELVDGDGTLVSFAYSYWIRNDLAISIGADLIESKVANYVSGYQVPSDKSVVIPVLLGIKYHFMKMTIRNNIRPFLFASIGPNLGRVTREFSSLGLEDKKYSETALASYIGLGTDIKIFKIFIAGVNGGYFLATDFKEGIGQQKSYSSPKFTVSMGIIL